MNENYHVIIPSWVMKINISANHKLLLGMVEGLSAQEGFCFASNEYLAVQLGVSERTIRRCLSELEDHKLVLVTQMPGNQKHKRTITVIADQRLKMTFDADESDTGDGQVVHVSGQTVHQPGQTVQNGDLHYIIDNKVDNKVDSNTLPGHTRPVQTKPKTTLCTPQSVSPEDLQKLIQNPRYGNGDTAFVLECFESMCDWSQANLKKKADWTAALRNWIKGNKPKQGNQPKTFAQIDRNESQAAINEFLGGE